MTGQDTDCAPGFAAVARQAGLQGAAARGL